MSILNIRIIGDPVLREKAKKVKEITDRTRELLDNMSKTMYDAPGIGLAAPQVGISQQLVVIDVDDDHGLYQLINPEIIDSSEDKVIYEEACLSVPDKSGNVVRPAEVTVKALNRDGEEIKLEADGLLARAVQHEIDHLHGILFVDKVLEVE